MKKKTVAWQYKTWIVPKVIKENTGKQKNLMP